MPQYVIRLTHSSDQCPTANAKVRDLFIKGMPAMPQLAEKLGLKFLAGPLILGAEHEGIAIVEADNVEAVQDFVIQSGMVQWNSVRVTAAMTAQQAVAELEKLTPLY